MTRLLSDNDLKYIDKALQTETPVCLERRLHGYAVEAHTIRAGKAWGVAMLIQLKESYGNTVTLQNFESVDKLRKAKGW